MALVIDYKHHPKETFYNLVKNYKDHFLIMDDVLASPEAYTLVYQDILDMMKYGFEYRQVREFPIKFKFHKKDKKVHKLEARHFLSNMILWYAFVDMECSEILDESFIMDFHLKSIRDMANYIDTKILPYHDGDFHSKNKVVDEIWYHVTAVANAFALLMGYSISSWDIMCAEESNPRIHELMYTHVDSTMQPKEIEDDLNGRTAELIKLFGESQSDLRPLLLSGKNISAMQFKEIFLAIGFKGDYSARTMLSMSKPGALSKKLNSSTVSVQLRQDYECCHSARPIYYDITNEQVLKMLDKRYYYDESGNMKLLDYQKDTHLIGKRVPFRSPTTCASEEGICRYCYGELFDINKDLYSAGSLAA